MRKHFERILLIDDDIVSNYINEIALQEMDFSSQIHVSENGKEALLYLNQSYANGTNSAPDLIFLDLNMPVMDGFQFLEEFEKLPLKKREMTSIILLTSSNAPSDLAKARQFNVDGYIVKPLCKKKVEQVFN